MSGEKPNDGYEKVWDGYGEVEEPKLNKLADLVDDLVVEMKHQAEHNSPITPNMIKQLEAIQTLIYQPD